MCHIYDDVLSALAVTKNTLKYTCSEFVALLEKLIVVIIVSGLKIKWHFKVLVPHKLLQSSIFITIQHILCDCKKFCPHIVRFLTYSARRVYWYFYWSYNESECERCYIAYVFVCIMHENKCCVYVWLCVHMYVELCYWVCNIQCTNTMYLIIVQLCHRHIWSSVFGKLTHISYLW